MTDKMALLSSDAQGIAGWTRPRACRYSPSGRSCARRSGTERGDRRALLRQPARARSSPRPTSKCSPRSPTTRRWRSSRRGSSRLLEETKRRERLQRYHSPAVVEPDSAERATPTRPSWRRSATFGHVRRHRRLHRDVASTMSRERGRRVLNEFFAADGRGDLRARRHARQVHRRRDARRVRRAVRAGRPRAAGGRDGARRCARSWRELNVERPDATCRCGSRINSGRALDRRHRLAQAPRVHGARRRRQHRGAHAG